MTSLSNRETPSTGTAMAGLPYKVLGADGSIGAEVPWLRLSGSTARAATCGRRPTQKSTNTAELHGGTLMQIDLTLEEITLLTELLHGDFGNLREEIYKTDDHNFKAELQAREKLMKALMAKLSSPEVTKTT